MRILMVSSYLPYPLINGGHIRLYNLIKTLSKKHKITLVCEKRNFQTEEDIKEVKKFCEEVMTVDRKKLWSWQDIFKTGISLYPFLLILHTPREMKAKLVEIMLQKTFDIIHVETFYVFQNVPKTYIPIVLAEHNVEYLVYKRYADLVPWYLKPFLLIDIKKMQYWEEYFWKKADKLIAVSEEEKTIMRREDAVVVPNGVDINQFKIINLKLRIKKKEKRVLFIGDFKWIQNRQAVEWILTEIWPIVISKIKNQKSKIDIKLWIVGKNIPESLKMLGDKTVKFDENAPKQTEKIFQQAAVLLAPIKVGGGTSYKILEAMASGVPVITTTLGAEGLDIDKTYDIVIGDTTEELARKTLDILRDNRQYEIIAANARSVIEKKYSWEIIAEKLDKVYQSVVSQ